MYEWNIKNNKKNIECVVVNNKGEWSDRANTKWYHHPGNQTNRETNYNHHLILQLHENLKSKKKKKQQQQQIQRKGKKVNLKNMKV